MSYTAQPIDSASMNPLQKVSLGKPYPIANYVDCSNFFDLHRNFLAAITKVVEPKFFHEAMQDEKWRETVTKEIEALELNEFWTVEDLPPVKKRINYKWLYKVKYQSDGSIKCYKVRLVI